MKSKRALTLLTNQIISKWERSTSAKETLRQAGLGELRVAMRLKELALQNESLAVAKDMTIHATKILDMVSPELGELDGFAVIVHRPGEQGKAVETGPQRHQVKQQDKKEQITE